MSKPVSEKEKQKYAMKNQAKVVELTSNNFAYPAFGFVLIILPAKDHSSPEGCPLQFDSNLFAIEKIFPYSVLTAFFVQTHYSFLFNLRKK